MYSSTSWRVFTVVANSAIAGERKISRARPRINAERMGLASTTRRAMRLAEALEVLKDLLFGEASLVEALSDLVSQLEEELVLLGVVW
jgi:hypothetical protein